MHGNEKKGSKAYLFNKYPSNLNANLLNDCTVKWAFAVRLKSTRKTLNLLLYNKPLKTTRVKYRWIELLLAIPQFELCYWNNFVPFDVQTAEGHELTILTIANAEVNSGIIKRLGLCLCSTDCIVSWILVILHITVKYFTQSYIN